MPFVVLGGYLMEEEEDLNTVLSLLMFVVVVIFPKVFEAFVVETSKTETVKTETGHLEDIVGWMIVEGNIQNERQLRDWPLIWEDETMVD